MNQHQLNFQQGEVGVLEDTPAIQQNQVKHHYNISKTNALNTVTSRGQRDTKQLNLYWAHTPLTGGGDVCFTKSLLDTASTNQERAVAQYSTWITRKYQENITFCKCSLKLKLINYSACLTTWQILIADLYSTEGFGWGGSTVTQRMTNGSWSVLSKHIQQLQLKLGKTSHSYTAVRNESGLGTKRQLLVTNNSHMFNRTGRRVHTLTSDSSFLNLRSWSRISTICLSTPSTLRTHIDTDKHTRCQSRRQCPIQQELTVSMSPPSFAQKHVTGAFTVRLLNAPGCALQTNLQAGSPIGSENMLEADSFK